MRDGRGSQRSFPNTSNAHNGSMGTESVLAHTPTTACDAETSVLLGKVSLFVSVTLKCKKYELIGPTSIKIT
jgi:hypothetical protein